MSTGPENKTPLARLADAYEPSDAEIERQLAKIQATLAKPSAAASPATKALVIGITCASLAFLGASYLSHVQERPRAADVSMASVPSALAPAPPGANSDVAEPADSSRAMPSADVASLPSVASVLAKKIAPPPPQAPSSAPSDTLEREARLLADAVRANERGEGERALEILERHARLFPNGSLVNERAAERIMVLCSLGKREVAKREARVFLDGRPKGPLAHRVETSCASEE